MMLPLAYFAPSHFCKERFQKDDNVFFLKKHSFFIIISNFSNVQSFLTFWKKRHNQGPKDIFKKQ